MVIATRYALLIIHAIGFLSFLAFISCNSKDVEKREQHRPYIHFTPPAKWMNDPNGMVFHNNTFHLFYQHYPDSTIWGPMHWAHATSSDLVTWQHQPIALYPDSLGYIFSGSAVVDSNNTSGFGKDGKAPLVAIFTHHDPVGEKEGRDDHQFQSIAYSTDNGKTWVKYANNPVLRNPGIGGFRDPKVSWHHPSKKWIMALATYDRITFYSSPDLKNWKKESEFGKTVGAHGGVWECPDLFPLKIGNEEVWILIVSLNPGGPNGGSGTQYFTGRFDGRNFVASDTLTRWIDYGPDNYAGVTWSNTGDRKIFLGWMNNWQYANQVPTATWRGAATLPRDLSLSKIDNSFSVKSSVSPEIQKLVTDTVRIPGVTAAGFDLTAKIPKLDGAARLSFSTSHLADFSITLSNTQGQKVVIGFDKAGNEYYIDRTQSGKTDFEKGFAARHNAPRISKDSTTNMELYIDNASVEMFADDGLTVMTAVFFPDSDYTKIVIDSPNGIPLQNLTFSKLKQQSETTTK